jgi:ribosome-binding factor A
MSTIRIQKVADLIRDELAAAVRDEVDEARRALVTITSVTLSPDLRLARVHVSVFPESADRDGILAAMRRAAGRLRRRLGRSVRLRRVPDLEFRLDTTAERSERIERLLRSEEDAAASETPGEEEA